MKKAIFFIFAISTVILLTGCGHNAIQYGDGVGLDVGINPENYTFSLNLRYGKILSAVTRDNVEIEMDGGVDSDGGITPSIPAVADGQSATPGKGNANVSSSGKLKIKIGRQINGYAVDLIEAGADPDKVVEVLKEK